MSSRRPSRHPLRTGSRTSTHHRSGERILDRSAGISPRPRRFPRRILAAIDESKILGIRADSPADHRFIGIWAVVVGDRVFARSWTLQPGGWYRTFLDNPFGTIQVGERQLRIRAVRAGSTRIRDAVERAYAQKYSTAGSFKYVRGFRTPRRREATMEFLPR